MHQNQTKSYQIILCAELNNLSIFLVENQQYDLAIDSLKQVVHMLKSSMSNSSSSSTHNSNFCTSSNYPSNDNNNNNNNILSIIQQDPIIKSARSRLQNFKTDDLTIRTDNNNDTNTSSTRTSPPKFHIKLPQRIQVAKYLSDICANNEVTVSKMFDIVSATVLFNLGVAHHIKENSCQQFQSTSISMSSPPSSVRSKALEFYNISWSILLQAASESPLNNSLHGELSISVLNNLCHLYRERRQYDIARDCLRQLGTMIIQKNYSINLDGLEEAIGNSMAPAA